MTKSSWVIYFPLIFPVSAPCPICTVEHTRVKTYHPFRSAAAELKSTPLLLPCGREVCRSREDPPRDWAGRRPQLQEVEFRRLWEPLQRKQDRVMVIKVGGGSSQGQMADSRPQHRAVTAPKASYSPGLIHCSPSLVPVMPHATAAALAGPARPARPAPALSLSCSLGPC